MEDIAIQTLIDECLAGSRRAFYKLYQRYSRRMYNAAFRVVRDQEEAEDVLQEAFVSAFNNLKDYRSESTFGAWLKRIVLNKAINQVKKRRMERIPEREDWDIAEEDTDDVLAAFPFTVDNVKAGIDKLPEGYRLVLSLYLIEGYDHGEIAEILGITASTSKSQLNRSKKKLRDILEGGS